MSTLVDEPGSLADNRPVMSTTPNLKQLLIQRNEWLDQQLMAAIRKSPDYAYISPAQSRLLAHMGGRPMSMAELARKLAISRQAVHKTVGELVRRGILAVEEDPQRRNSKQVRYTELGKDLNRGGARMIADIEKRLARRLGADRYRLLLELLGEDWTQA